MTSRLTHRDRATAVVVHDDCLLLAGMTDHAFPGGPMRWYLAPGGGVEEGESIEEAVLRELHEEAGMVGRLGPELLTVGGHGQWMHCFVVEVDDPTIGAVTGPELVEVSTAEAFATEWIPLDELDTTPLFPRVLVDHVRRHVAGEPPPATVPVVVERRPSWVGLRPEPSHLQFWVWALLTDGDRVALVDGPDGWALPAGRLEGHDDVDHRAAGVAAVRGAFGVEATPLRPVAALGGHHPATDVWLVHVADPSAIPATAWHRLDELGSLPMARPWLAESIVRWAAADETTPIERWWVEPVA